MWKVSPYEINYRIEQNTIIINTCAYDDEDVTEFHLSPDGTITSPDSIDLRQFNVCGDLLRIIRTLSFAVSEITGKPEVTFEIAEVLGQPSIFKVSPITTPRDKLYDYECNLELKGKTFKLEKQFIKYTNIDSEICQLPLTVLELANFTIHLQKHLMEAEMKAGGDGFFQVDKEVEELLTKSA